MTRFSELFDAYGNSYMLSGNGSGEGYEGCELQSDMIVFLVCLKRIDYSVQALRRKWPRRINCCGTGSDEKVKKFYSHFRIVGCWPSQPQRGWRS